MRVKIHSSRAPSSSGVPASSQRPLNHRGEAIGRHEGRTSKRTRCSAGRILMLVLALTVPLFAQAQSTSAIWRGLVNKSVGTPIVGATVRLKGTPTAESTTVADGSFSLAALPAGEYKLTIVADGTTATYAQTITLTSDSPAVVITVSNSREITVARSSRRIRRAARNSQVKR
jgi:hypothetical protein